MAVVAKCKKCRYETVDTLLENGLCEGCRLMVNEKSRGHSAPREDGLVTARGVRHRCYRLYKCCPKHIVALIAGRYEIPEEELPKELKWRKSKSKKVINCERPKTGPRFK